MNQDILLGVRMLRLVLIGVLLFGASRQVLLAQSLGSIAGTVAGDDSQTLAVMVTLNGVPPLRSSGSAKSGANGAFTISNLAAGTYHICVESGGVGYLDPCAWDPILPTVQIAAGQSLTGYRMTVKRGTALQVRINDAAGALSASAQQPAGKAPPTLLLGVFTTRGLFHLLATTGKDAAGFNQQVTVQQNASVRLHVSGQGLQITDANGAAVNPGITTVTPGAGPAAPIVFTISPKP
jgi:hypothetical protein